jgi:phosphatidylserine decarboxylase
MTPSAPEPKPSGGFAGRLFVWLQYVLPQHGLSRLVLAATRVQAAWFKNALTLAFLKLYPVDLSEAEQTDPRGYVSFNAFFTRALRPGSRPIAADPADVASPVDGTVSECGQIEGDSLLQAKGRRYTLSDLLAGQAWAQRFERGNFATIYLAPCNYHRIHMPVAGRLRESIYVPGRLFSVNAATARGIPRLFARNERILTLFEGAAGQFALVMVGALNVGSMATVWAGDVTPRRPRLVTRLPDAPVELDKGAELGRFNMGSTVILLFEPQRARWDGGLRGGAALRVGQRIGRIA